MADPDPIVVAVRNAAMEFGLRVEVSSDPRLPVAMTDQQRTTYGFGVSLSEAFAAFEKKKALKRAREAKQ